ncbi:MAG TPA: hypothetical protein VGJ92_09205, partial [Methanocella sp.]
VHCPAISASLRSAVLRSGQTRKVSPTAKHLDTGFSRAGFLIFRGAKRSGHAGGVQRSALARSD